MEDEITKDFNWAVKNGDLVNVKSIVESNPKLLQYEDSNKRNACHWGADYNQSEVLEYLISKGAKFDDCDKYGITPLLAAVYESHAATVELLVKHKANKSIKGPDGKTAIEAAESEAIKKLLK